MININEINTMGKAQLKSLIRPLSRQEAIELINEVISKKRGIPLSCAKRKHIVFKSEVIYILDYLGVYIAK